MLAREQPKSMRILLIKRKYKLYTKKKKTQQRASSLLDNHLSEK